MDKIREAKTKVEYTGERIIKKKDGKLTAMEYCEKHYPKMMKEYKKVMWKQYETFCRKQRNYGPHNISVGTSLETEDDIKLSLTGLWFRLNDKIQRMANLILKQVKGSGPQVEGEKLEDTARDICNYGAILELLITERWK